MALRQTNATFPGVSRPSSGVRSIIDIASLRPATFAEVLMLRFANAAARSSTMIWSIVGICPDVGDLPLRFFERARVFMSAAGASRGEGITNRRGQLNRKSDPLKTLGIIGGIGPESTI